MNKLINTGVKVNGKALYINNVAQTFRLGTKGKAANVAHLFGMTDKGTARRLRKLLHGLGYGNTVRVSRVSADTLIDLKIEYVGEVKLAA